jgi:cobalt-zinc-cadmium efflux system protein
MMSHSHNHQKPENSGIKIAFFLNFLFAIAEIAGGIIFNSLAIISNAIHDVGDTFSIGISWILQKISKKGRDATFSFGYKRFVILGSILNSVVLLVGSSVVIIHSITRFNDLSQPHTTGMIFMAFLGIIVNGFAVYKLRKNHSLNERSVRIHLLEDVFGWFAILISAVIMKFVNIPQLDKILSVAISLWVIYNSLSTLIGSFKIMLQAIPDDAHLETIKLKVETIEGIKEIHDLHVWSLDGNHHISSLHILLNENVSEGMIIRIKQEVRLIFDKLNIQHVTIEIEYQDESCELKDC